MKRRVGFVLRYLANNRTPLYIKDDSTTTGNIDNARVFDTVRAANDARNCLNTIWLARSTIEMVEEQSVTTLKIKEYVG